MVRNYDPDRPVSSEALKRIAAAAQRAPKRRLQPRSAAAVITDPDERWRVAEPL